MLFIFLFTLGTLTVPLILDFDKHGQNNILARSINETLGLPKIVALTRAFSSTKHSLFSLADSLIRKALIGAAAIFAIFLAGWLVATINPEFAWTAIVIFAAIAFLFRTKY